MKTNKTKYTPAVENDFATTLKKRVNDFFLQKKKGSKADWRMVLKSVIIFSIFLGSYALILSNILPAWLLLVTGVIFGFSTMMIAFTIGHDAAHNAYTGNTKIDHVLSYSMNLIGINRYVWHLRHNLSHHSVTNIPHEDVDNENSPYARLHPQHPLKPFHRYQHIYLPLMWALFSIHMIFRKDFQLLSYKKLGNVHIDKHPVKEYVILIMSKLFYAGYAIVVPLIVIDLPWYEIVGGMAIMHVFCGYLIAIVFLPVHLLEDSVFPEKDREGRVSTSWMEHELTVTSDFNPTNKVLTWISGGANLHVAHHLFPHICHVHYYDVTEIIKTTAAEFDLEYKSNGFIEGMRSHITHLKKMGKEAAEERVADVVPVFN